MGALHNQDIAKIKEAFSKIKTEMNDHLEAINQTTNEIQSNYEHMCKIESKVDTLTEKVEELSATLNELLGRKIAKKTYTIPQLNLREQEVFLVLYAHEKPLTAKEIARKTALTEQLVATYITTLIAKGVPIMRKRAGSDMYIELEKDFREIQTKENILNIHQDVGRSVDL